jgi:hypothetical protein
MYVFQCPRCKLLFNSGNELEHHLGLDHPDFHVTEKTIEDSLIRATHRPRHAPSVHADEQD